MQEFLENLKPLEELKSLRELKIIIIIDNKINRFNLNDINFFDLFYEGKLIDIAFIIKYIDKSTFFRDIYVFINRVKNVTHIKSDILLR